MEQWLKEKRHESALIGLGLSVLCLVIFGAENFMIPSMVAILVVLTAFRRPLDRQQDTEAEQGGEVKR